MRDVAVSRILPPREDEGESIGVSLRIPEALLKRIDAVAKEAGYSRTEVLLHFTRWAIQEYEAERRASNPKR